MKVVLQDNRRYMLRFDKGEDVMLELPKFLGQQHIEACTFTAIGTSYELELGFFNEHLKEYRTKRFMESMEIASVVGNGGIIDGKPAVHAHGLFTRTDFSAVGGHIMRLVTLATCEVFLIKLEGKLERKNNPDFNLNLLA